VLQHRKVQPGLLRPLKKFLSVLRFQLRKFHLVLHIQQTVILKVTPATASQKLNKRQTKIPSCHKIGAKTPVTAKKPVMQI
jgi:hypothetical protein